MDRKSVPGRIEVRAHLSAMCALHTLLNEKATPGALHTQKQEEHGQLCMGSFNTHASVVSIGK